MSQFISPMKCSAFLPFFTLSALPRQLSRVQCMEKEAGLVEDRYCQDQPRPDDRSRECNIHACPAWWWSGRWQPCSITCGSDRGTRRRTVICVRSFGPTEQMALLDSDCDIGDKPHETEVCPELPPCPKMVDWSVGPWSQVRRGARGEGREGHREGEEA